MIPKTRTWKATTDDGAEFLILAPTRRLAILNLRADGDGSHRPIVRGPAACRTTKAEPVWPHCVERLRGPRPQNGIRAIRFAWSESRRVPDGGITFRGPDAVARANRILADIFADECAEHGGPVCGPCSYAKTEIRIAYRANGEAATYTARFDVSANGESRSMAEHFAAIARSEPRLRREWAEAPTMVEHYAPLWTAARAILGLLAESPK